jgi:NAD(P)-dependent dehydrogenase (short-subunit alcohol dehydrogenase family)
MSSIILVTGASTGIGQLTARALAAAGHTVYASMRDITGRNAARVRELRDWSFANGHDLRALELDVLSQSSVDRAVRTIVDAQGRLDTVVHNAGHLVVGPTEAFTPEEIMKVLDTNFLGRSASTAQCCR